MSLLLQNALGNTSTLYIDPSSVSILLTSISGIVIAVGAFVVIYWRKAKNKVANTLNIDKNAKKEVEDDIVIKNKESENK